MNERLVARLTGLAALIAVPLYVIAMLLQGNPPGGTAGGAQVIAYATAHHDALLIAIYLTGLALALALCVSVGLAALLRGDGEGTGVIAVVGLVGGVGWVATVLVGLLFPLGLVYRTPGGDPAVARLLLDLSALSFTLSGFPTAVNVGAFSLLMLRSRLFPNWLAWLGLLTGAAHLVAGAAFAHDGLFAPEVAAGQIAPALYILWGLCIGMVLLRRAGSIAPARIGAVRPAAGAL
ncbi:MAG TPA: DUF4386 family protein [Dehalococcoidia bacterium]|nr:DUF4386 family protein [Dehalococcoidia bacterium]